MNGIKTSSLLALAFLTAQCAHKKEPTHQKTVPFSRIDAIPMPKEPRDASSKRKAWLNDQKLEGAPHAGFGYQKTEVEGRYGIKLPCMPTLIDDPVVRQMWTPSWGYLGIGLPSSFWFRLPEAVRQALVSQGIDPQHTDIFVHLQSRESLGESQDHQGKALTTHLKVHGWADPNAPHQKYRGLRMNREMLFGIFESTYAKIDQRSDLRQNELRPLSVHVHDGLWSPRVASLSLKHDKPWKKPDDLSEAIDESGQNTEVEHRSFVSEAVQDPANEMAFYSVVIGDIGIKAPQRRAAVTLHWILPMARFFEGAQPYYVPYVLEEHPHDQKISVDQWIQKMREKKIDGGPGFPMFQNLLGLPDNAS